MLTDQSCQPPPRAKRSAVDAAGQGGGQIATPLADAGATSATPPAVASAPAAAPQLTRRPPLPKRPRKPRRALLIPNWRRAWRMLSVQAAAVAVTIGLLPPDQQAAVLAAVGIPAERLPLAVGLLFIAARLIGQPDVDRDPDNHPRSG